MATCTRAGLISDGKCFTQSVLTKKQQDAMLVYLMAVYLKLVSSAADDYVTDPSDLVGSLLQDAHTMTCGMTKDQRAAAYIAIAKSSADTDETQDQLMDGIKCLQNATQEQLDEAKLFLLCSITDHITYYA